MREGLQDIERITRMILDAELAELMALSEAIDRNRREVREMRRAQSARGVSLGQTTYDDDLALSVGQDDLWQGWMARTVTRLNAEAAKVASMREAQRLKASKSFGRVEAVSKLRAKARETQRLAMSRGQKNE